MRINPIRFIECRGSPREMGRQYGEQAREEILGNIAALRVDAPEPRADEFSGLAVRVLDRFAPEILAELTGVAEGAGAPLFSILRLNQVDTFGAGSRAHSPGCTSMALSSGPDGSVLGKNNDGAPGEPVFIVRKTLPASGLAMLQVTYAGWLSGLDAMNGAGVANGHNSVGSVFDKPGMRIDIRLWMYRLMSVCRSTAELLDMIDIAPLTGKGFNIVVTDAAGDSCALEAAVPLVSVRDRGRPFVYATNHYAGDAIKDADLRTPEKKRVSIYRLGYLRWREAVRPPGCVGDIKDILRSHDPWAPCRHGGPHLSHTLWSMICVPASRGVLVSSGAPCDSDYAQYDI